MAQDLKGETQTQNGIQAQDWLTSLNKAAAAQNLPKQAHAVRAVSQKAQAIIAQEIANGDHGCIHFIDPANPCCQWYNDKCVDMCSEVFTSQINHYYSSKTFAKGFAAKAPGWDPVAEQHQWFLDHPGNKCSDDLIKGAVPYKNPTAEWMKMHPYGVYGLKPNVGAAGIGPLSVDRRARRLEDSDQYLWMFNLLWFATTFS